MPLPWPFSNVHSRSTLALFSVCPCDLCTLIAQARIRGTYGHYSLPSVRVGRARCPHLFPAGFYPALSVHHFKRRRDAQQGQPIIEAHIWPLPIASENMLRDESSCVLRLRLRRRLGLTMHHSNMDSTQLRILNSHERGDLPDGPVDKFSLYYVLPRQF